MTTRMLIVEDEPLIAQDLRFLLDDMGIHLVEMAMSYEVAVDFLHKQTFDLILLDINLSGEKDGVHLAAYINEHIQTPFIFITSYFNQSVISRAKLTKPQAYLVKPYHPKDVRVNIEMALYKAKENVTIQPVFVKEKGGSVKIDPDRLLYLEAVDSYTRLIFDNEELIVSQNLKSIHEKLASKDIVRVHKSFCVKVSAISMIRGGSVFINDHKIPIGRAYKEEFNAHIAYL